MISDDFQLSPWINIFLLDNDWLFMICELLPVTYFRSSAHFSNVLCFARFSDGCRNSGGTSPITASILS
jgi:hypothetical protein